MVQKRRNLPEIDFSSFYGLLARDKSFQTFFLLAQQCRSSIKKLIAFLLREQKSFSSSLICFPPKREIIGSPHFSSLDFSATELQQQLHLSPRG
jgi:hypothetical protein